MAYALRTGGFSLEKGGGHLTVNTTTDSGSEVSSTRYLVARHRVCTARQWRLIESYTQATREFIEHLLHCASTTHTDSDWVPVHYKAMHEYLTDCPWVTERVWEPLKERGWVEVTEYTAKLKSREYRLTNSFWDDWAESTSRRPTKRMATGKRHRKGRLAQLTHLTDASDNAVPGLTGGTLRYFKGGVDVRLNWTAMKTFTAGTQSCRPHYRESTPAVPRRPAEDAGHPWSDGG